MKDLCYCNALGAILIIALVWLAPAWAPIAITIIAALMLLTSFTGCVCKPKK